MAKSQVFRLKCGVYMLLQMNEKRSLMLVQIMIAFTAVALPALIGFLSVSVGLYMLFTIYCITLICRIKKAEKIESTVFSVMVSALLCYALLSSLWIDNREGHLLYITGLGIVLIFSWLLTDSFLEINKETTTRRFMYLLSFGGVLCALANIIYWLLEIIPYGENVKMSLGFGNSDFLSVFMFSCFCLAGNLLKGNAKIRKGIILVFMLVMGFVFVMTASMTVWAMALIFALLCYVKKKNNNIFFTCSLAVTGLFFVFTAVWALRENNDAMFNETFLYGIKSLFGKGGGYLSGKELFIGASVRYKTTGLLAYLTACSGVLGIAASAILVLVGYINFIKLKNYSSLYFLILTALILFLPFGGIFTIVLYSSVMVYNLCMSGLTVKRHIKKSDEFKVRRTITSLIILCFISVILLVGTFVRNFADSLYQNKEYRKAYEYYKTAASINLSDAQSCKGAARAIRRGKMLAENKEEAISLIDNAIKREPDNLEHIKEKALIYKACGDYSKAAQQYRQAIRKAINDDEYNLLLSDVLYDLIKLYPKGSVESREIYNEILVIAQNTENLDLRKQINDIADKALAFKKGEIENVG